MGQCGKILMMRIKMGWLLVGGGEGAGTLPPMGALIFRGGGLYPSALYDKFAPLWSVSLLYIFEHIGHSYLMFLLLNLKGF